MRLAESLHRNILKAGAGGLLNRFKIIPRRDVFFFENVLGTYIKECEKSGHSEEIEELGQNWGALTMKQLLPPIFKKLPPTAFLNLVMKKVWVNLGLMSDLQVSKKGDIVSIKTKNETNVRAMGKNHFAVGFYKGILSMLYGSQAESLSSNQTSGISEYTFKIKRSPFRIDSKTKAAYSKLNHFEEGEELTFKKALELKIFRLEENQLFFRGRHLSLLENTIYHLFSNSGMLLDRVPEISNGFFKNVVEVGSSPQEKLVLLKSLLQTMGWGTVKIVQGKNKIWMDFKNPPYGLQAEKDNWVFLIQTILGYLWLIDRGYRVRDVKEEFKNLIAVYTIPSGNYA